MDEELSVIVNGKELPVWTLKKRDELDYRELSCYFVWNYVCRLVRDVMANPEEWVEKIRNPKNYTKYRYEPDGFFRFVCSEDFFYIMTKNQYKLDDKLKGTLSDFTYRQVLESLRFFALDKWKSTPKDERKDLAFN